MDLNKQLNTDTEEVVYNLIRIIKDKIDYCEVVNNANKLARVDTTPEHSSYCSCNGVWSLCCDNKANYPVHLGGDKITYEECCCGCMGDWSACENNRENYTRDYNDSHSPSPHRHDEDWFIQEINPVMEEQMCDITLRSPTLPNKTMIRKMRESYLEKCVEKYYNLN